MTGLLPSLKESRLGKSHITITTKTETREHSTILRNLGKKWAKILLQYGQKG